MWLIDKLGADKARQMWQLAEDAKNLAKTLIRDNNIDCDLKPGIAHADHKASYVDESKAYVDFLREQYDYTEIEYLDQPTMAELVGSDGYYGGSLDMGAGHLHPLNYALGLAQVAIDSGASLYELTPVSGYTEGSPNRVQTDRGVIEDRSHRAGLQRLPGQAGTAHGGQNHAH